MAAESVESDVEIWRKVLDKTSRRLKKYLIPDSIIDQNTGFELFSFTDRRDIKEERNTSEKNQAILARVRSKGLDGYLDFKKRLKMTNQDKLVDFLILTEKGLDTNEIERQLDKMAEQTLSEYSKFKKELKDGLIEFYKTRHSKVFLSPLFEENDTPLASVYIRPELSSIFSNKQTSQEDKSPLKLLSEMFKTKNKDHREIYVIADAGLGKTAFSNYLATLWCQACFPDETMANSFVQDDIDCMQEFDFLFLVLLRDSYDLCSIDDLIFEKIVSNLGLPEKLTEDLLLKILKYEKCLIILDGLDEWTHPEKKCYRLPRSIPHRNDREKCTVLTTTRPWKLGVINLNSRELGNKIELTKLSGESAVKLAERILQRLKYYPDNDALKSDVRKFMEEIKSIDNVQLTSVPLLLIYTICIWCNGVQMRHSKCELYINIIELLLSRAIQKLGGLHQSQELVAIDILECFNEYAYCKQHFTLLVSLGKLAYYTLSSKTKENTLVFDGSIVKQYLKPDVIEFTLHSGILSESTTKTLTKIISKMSFSHKTIQEFFAAIFISSQSEAQETVLKRYSNVKDILDMSIISEFISKMNASLMCSILKCLPSVINEEDKILNLRTRTDDMSDNPLYNIQNMFLVCLKEMHESGNMQLCLQDLFIDMYSEDSKQLQGLSKQNETNIKSLYINTRYTLSNFSKITDLFSLRYLNHIQKLYFCGNKGKVAEIIFLLFPSLQNVTLRSGELTNDVESLSAKLARLHNLKYLRIEYFTFSHRVLEIIFNFISSQKEMKVLTLKWIHCKEHGLDCKRWNLDLSYHLNLSKLDLFVLPMLQINITTPSLVEIRLWGINIDLSSSLLSRDMLNIEHLELGGIEMCEENLQNLITMLENLPQQVTVKMDAIKPETGFERTKTYIQNSQKFHLIYEGHWFMFRKTQ